MRKYRMRQISKKKEAYTFLEECEKRIRVCQIIRFYHFHNNFKIRKQIGDQ